MLPNKQLRRLLFDAITRGDQQAVIELLSEKFATQISDFNGNSALHHACKNNQPEIIKLLLDAGADPGSKNSIGRNTVAEAVNAGLPDIVSLLLDAVPCSEHKARLATEALAALDGYHDDGHEPEDWATYTPKLIEHLYQSISLLLKAGANPNVPDRHGNPILYLYCGDIEFIPIVELLLQAGAQPNLATSFGDFPMSQAVTFDPTAQLARLLMQYGAAPTRCSRDNPIIISSLYHLAPNVLPEFIKELLQKGVAPDVRDDMGCTALMHAARTNRTVDPKVVEHLLEFGADKDAVNNYGYSVADHILYRLVHGKSHIMLGEPEPHHRAILSASLYGSLVQIEQELKHDIPGRIRTLALTLAAERGHYTCCKLLLDAGADPNGRCLFGNRPLVDATKELQIRVMRLLIKHGAAVDGCGVGSCSSSYSPLIIACQSTKFTEAGPCKARFRAARLLLGKGADVHACGHDDAGYTALRQAVMVVHDLPLVELLLAHGANPNTADSNGATPLTLAERFFPVAVPLLLEGSKRFL